MLKEYLLKKPHRLELFAKFSRTFTKVVEPEKWLFIVGCYNSGTTLLASLLATHSKISYLDEGVFKTSQLTTPEELGWTRLWCQVVDKVRLNSEDRAVDVRKLKKDWMLFFDKTKPVFLEKSIVNSARMTWLQENFSNSYFLFIVRNGYAVAEGIRRRTAEQLKDGQRLNSQFTFSYPIELCAQQWVTTNAIVESDAKKIRRFKRIFYEDLCDYPCKTISDIYAFLGLNDESSGLLEVPRWKINQYNSQIRNMNARSIANLSVEDVKTIEEIAGKMLAYYDYQRASGSQSEKGDDLGEIEKQVSVLQRHIEYRH
jgi:hypothetical protein